MFFSTKAGLINIKTNHVAIAVVFCLALGSLVLSLNHSFAFENRRKVPASGEEDPNGREVKESGENIRKDRNGDTIHFLEKRKRQQDDGNDQADFHDNEQHKNENHEAVMKDETMEDESHNRKRRSADRGTLNQSDFSISGGGAVYVRWGRSSCPPDPYTELVYSGIGGGSHYTHEGGATNHLCLPSDPVWGRYDDGSTGHAFIYGMEYEDENMFLKTNTPSLVNQNIPCAVCRSMVRTSSVMIPARNVCYDGWTLEYHGYLMAGHHGHKAGTEYLCFDNEPDADPAGFRDENGAIFYRVEAACGSLPCPKYIANRELTCAVCSK